MSYILTAAIIVPVAVLLLIVRYGEGWSEDCDGEARRQSEAKKDH